MSSYLTKLSKTVTSGAGVFDGLHIDERVLDEYVLLGDKNIKDDVWAKNVLPYILGYESNFGRRYVEGYNPKIKSKKKREEANKRRRRRQGDGSQMNSQIQFHVRSAYAGAGNTALSEQKDKVYKIKCFRQSTFQVPGILKEDYVDIIPSLIMLQDYFRIVKKNPNIALNIESVHSTLNNYKCKLIGIDNDLMFILPKINKLVRYEKENNEDQAKIYAMLEKSPIINDKLAASIKPYIPVNRYNIAEIKFDEEHSSCRATVKFYRPSHKTTKKDWYTKRTTLKIFQSGKINIDSVKSKKEGANIYYWFNNFINKYYNKIIFDPSVLSDTDSGSDSSEDIM